jgi:hypothetical protein
MKVAFMNSSHRPQCKPNPTYRNGKHVDLHTV